MVIVALAFVLVPLLRTRHARSADLSDHSSNVAIFRAQKREIESDLSQALISADERDQALRELAIRVAAEVSVDASTIDRAAGAPDTESKRAWIFAVIAAVGFPLSAVLAYGTIGTPSAITGSVVAAPAQTGQAAHPAAPGSEPPMSDRQIVAMVDSLAQKMAANPSDPKGWILLARSTTALGRFAEANKAYERALALQPNDANLLADYADAAVMGQQGRFDGKPYQIIQQALKIDPVNMKALALAGTAEMRMGNQAASLKHWEKIKSLVAKDSDDYREVEMIIAEVKGGAPAAVAPAPAKVEVAATPSGGAERITGQVTIAPELLAKITPQDVLFVFARAVNGPKMPLAITRVPVPNKWPFVFELNDAMAMSPAMKLSAFPEVTIEARISKSGGAQMQPGDLGGQSAPLKPGTSNVAVTISRVVP